MAAQKQISCCDLYDGVPPISSNYPWFVGQNQLGEAKDDQNQIFYNRRNPLSRRIPELIGRRIRGCFHGWLILSDHPDMVMWNPITSESIRLPPLAHDDDSYHCCLSSPPDDPGSVVMLTSIRKPAILFCRLDGDHRKNLMRWTQLSYAEHLNQLMKGVCSINENLEEDAFLTSPTCCNGKVYALTLGDNYRFVIQVDIDKLEDAVTLLPVVKAPDSCFLRCPSFNSCRTVDVYIITMTDELLCIETGFEDENRKTVGDVFLSKLDLTNMMWEEMKDLTGDIFVVSNDFLIYSPPAGSELGGGSINIILGQERLHSYNVKSKTVFLSSMPCLAQTSQQSVWTMLEYYYFRLGGDRSDSEQEQGGDSDENKVVRSVTCDADESHLLGIPFDVLKSIVERCVGVDYLNFRAASKYCRSAAPCDESFVRRLRTYSLPSPWLMVFDQYQGIITFTDPMSGDKYFVKTPEELIDYQICCCRFGWLLMYKIDDGPMVFYSPFTNQVREIPRPELCLDSYCFSEPPTSLDCKVLGFLKSGKNYVRIYPLAWEERQEEEEPHWYVLYRESLRDDPQYFRFPTFHDGDYYALSDAGGIHVLKNLVSLDPSWEVLIAEAPKSNCSTSTTPAKRFLAECDQHVIQVVVGVFGESIEVFNLNESKREWEKMDGLGNHTLYICGTTCLCVEATTPEMGNKIYFPILRSKKIVFYSLETCRFHTFDGKNVGESFGDFFETEHLTYRNPYAWIEPSWS